MERKGRGHMVLLKIMLYGLLLNHVFLFGRGCLTASGTIVAISTSKGSTFFLKQGDTTSMLSSAHTPGAHANEKKWIRYEKPISNTFSFGMVLNVSTTTASSIEISDRGLVNGTQSLHINLSSNIARNRKLEYDILKSEDIRNQFFKESTIVNNTSTNITVPLGDTALLPRTVAPAYILGKRSISWIRHRDLHILTSMKSSYIHDTRFSILHSSGSRHWTLQIKSVEKRDSGRYECQVSLSKGIISNFINLFVEVPEAVIFGNGEYHFNQGVAIQLECLIKKSSKPPNPIYWFHNEVILNYWNSTKVKVHTMPGAMTSSVLTIRNFSTADSGNYTCMTIQGKPASIKVYVNQASGLSLGDDTPAISLSKTAEGTNLPSPCLRDSGTDIAISALILTLTFFVTIVA